MLATLYIRISSYPVQVMPYASIIWWTRWGSLCSATLPITYSVTSLLLVVGLAELHPDASLCAVYLNEYAHWSCFFHDDVIRWKHFPCYWPFVWKIHRSPVNSPLRGQWRGALMFSFICAWINGWVNKREAEELRHHRAHYDVIIMFCSFIGMYYFILLISLRVIAIASKPVKWPWRVTKISTTIIYKETVNVSTKT